MSELGGQLQALRQEAAVCIPGLRAVVGVSGPDHVQWLERITSMPLADLARGQCRWTTLMDGKGKLRADLRVMATGSQEGLLLEMPAGQSAQLLRVLDMYILRDKVRLDDRTGSHAFLAALGPAIGAVLTECALPAPMGDADEVGRLPLVEQDDLVAAPSRLYGVPGVDLLVPAEQGEALVTSLAAAGATLVGLEALQVVRIERGVPWFTEDLSQDVIPLEAGLEAHVSVTKGCYPGQEVVARIHNLGQVARRLVRLVTDGQPALAPGDALSGCGDRAGQEAGRLTSVAFDPLAGRTRALGFVRRAFWKEGTAVSTGAVELHVEGPAGA
jgi:folate-binding protein YgfZ